MRDLRHAWVAAGHIHDLPSITRDALRRTLRHLSHVRVDDLTVTVYVVVAGELTQVSSLGMREPDERIRDLVASLPDRATVIVYRSVQSGWDADTTGQTDEELECQALDEVARNLLGFRLC